MIEMPPFGASSALAEQNYAIGGKPPLTPKQAAEQRRRPPETTTPEQRERQQSQALKTSDVALHQLPPSLSRDGKISGREERAALQMAV